MASVYIAKSFVSDTRAFPVSRVISFRYFRISAKVVTVWLIPVLDRLHLWDHRNRVTQRQVGYSKCRLHCLNLH